MPRIAEASGHLAGQLMALIERSQRQQAGIMVIWPPEKSALMG